jgi:hypothetical protein
MKDYLKNCMTTTTEKAQKAHKIRKKEKERENVEIVKQKKKSYNITEHLCDSKKLTISGILVDVFDLI